MSPRPDDGPAENESSAPEPSLDPLLGLDAYAIGYGRGLSSQTWRVLDRDTNEIIAAGRPRDPVRSLLMGATVIVAFLVVAGSAGALHSGGAAAAGIAVVFASSLIVVLLLAPVVAFRKPRPIQLCAADDGRILLWILRRTRFGIVRVWYDVIDPDGAHVGAMVCAPSLWPPAHAWELRASGQSPLHARGPSWFRRLWESFGRGIALQAGIGHLFRASRASAKAPPKFKVRIRIAAPGASAPLARGLAREGWTWLLFEDADRTPEVSALALAASLLIIADECA